MDTAGNTGLSQAVSYSVYLTQKRRTFSASTRKAPFPHLSKKGGARTDFMPCEVKPVRPEQAQLRLRFAPCFAATWQSIHSCRKVNKFIVEQSNNGTASRECGEPSLNPIRG